MRRITLLLASAAIALTGTVSASANHGGGDGQTCLGAVHVCACVTVTSCGQSQYPKLQCINVDLDDNGTYETICLY